MKRRFPLRVSALVLAGTMSLPALAQSAPAETQPPNAPNQQPQSPDQTRAPQPQTMPKVNQEVVARDLPQLWALEFLPDNRMLVTVKEGGMLVLNADGSTAAEIEGVPEVFVSGQGGLLDVALAPDFQTSNRIFFSYSEPREGGNGTTVASATLVLDTDGGHLDEVQVIFRQMPTYNGPNHFGSRLVFSPDGNLFVTVGERSDAAVRVQAQEVASGLGKIFRIDQTGAAPEDNPLIGREGALPEIWSLGHRNMQSAALDGQGRLWTIEHGPRGGDELNFPEPGKNYGWPEVTYGIDYSGRPIGAGITAKVETEQPVYYWDPVIAPSGMAYYDAAEFPEWNNSFLVGGLVAQSVVVVHLQNDRVAFEERVPLNARVRDVKVGPEGAVYAVTESREGSSQIVRLTKAN